MLRLCQWKKFLEIERVLCEWCDVLQTNEIQYKSKKIAEKNKEYKDKKGMKQNDAKNVRVKLSK